MNFTNKKVTRTYTTPHKNNCWGAIESIGWRKVKKTSTDGATNMFLILSTAKANNKTVSGTIDDGSNELTALYL